MWMTALRDLQWRRRRFLIAVIGTSLVFGMMGPLCGLPRSATTRARTPSVLTGYSVRAFRDRFGETDLRRMVAGDDGTALPALPTG